MWGNAPHLISLPIVKSYTAQFLHSIIGSSAGYISAHSSTGYKTHVPGFGPADFPVSPDPGYFVYLTDDTGFTVSGVVPGEKTVSINKGWNLIWWTSLEKSSATASFVDPLNAGIVVMKDGSGNYRTYIAGFSGPDDNFDMEPGHRYYVYASSNSILQYGDQQ